MTALPRRAVVVALAAATFALTACSAPAATAPAAPPAPAAPAASGTPSVAAPEAPGTPADGAASPLDFTGATVDGGRFDAATLAGTPVVLWFWAPF